MEFVEVPYIDQSEVDTLDATSLGATVTVRILLILHFLVRNHGKRGGGAADHGDSQPQFLSTTVSLLSYNVVSLHFHSVPRP